MNTTKALCLGLALQLGLLPASTTLAQVSQAPSTPSRMAVVEVHDGKVKAAMVTEVGDSLREAMAQLTDLKPMDAEEVNRYIQTHPELLHVKQNDPYYRYAKEAKDLFLNFEFSKATELLDKTIASYRAGPTAMLVPFDLTNAYWLLSYIQLSNHQEKAAEASWREAIRLSPKEDISERLYPPQITDPYRRLRTKYLEEQKKINLEIQSNVAKTQVYVNGKLRGEAPVQLEWTAGEHFVVAVAEGYQPEVQRLELSKATVQKFQLKPASKTSFTGEGLNLSEVKDVASQVQVASNLAEALGLSKVVLVWLQERGWNYQITARMIDPNYQASYKEKSVEVVDFKNDVSTAVTALAKDMEQMNRIDLAKNPEKYAEGEVAVLGRKRKSSWVKSPWLWTAIGVAVAGGATAGILAAQGGEDSGNLGGFGGGVPLGKK